MDWFVHAIKAMTDVSKSNNLARNFLRVAFGVALMAYALHGHDPLHAAADLVRAVGSVIWGQQ